MKELTVRSQIEDLLQLEDILQIENIYKVIIPNNLKQFLLKYQGAYFKECIYRSTEGIFYALHGIAELRGVDNVSVETLIKGNEYYKFENFIPFAIDPGGWVFNLSIGSKTYNQVWVDKFDSGEEDPFEFVCNSFEEFIDGLMTEEDAIKLGY